MFYSIYTSMDSKEILQQLHTQLVQHSDPQVAQSGQRFFKESVKMYGVKSATVEKISKEIFQHIKTWDKDQIFEMCEKLLQSGYMEESFVACHRSYALAKQYTSQDIKIFEHRVQNYVNNRATCDTLCNHTIGTYIENFPDTIKTLKIWTKSPNRWTKRAAAVSLIIPAKKGLFLNDILEIANALLLDSDDMVQK